MTTHPNHHAEVEDRTLFGFWTYIMTDCILFSILFATYLVLHKNVAGGPSAKDLFDPTYALIETLILLVSSFTSGVAMLAVRTHNKAKLIGWFLVTFLLGAAFVGMELREFAEMVRDGNSWKRSGFLSSYFTLVGTHGCHITAGLLWMVVLMGQVLKRGLDHDVVRRLTLLRMFWHFLDLVWIFIFTIVYLAGVST